MEIEVIINNEASRYTAQISVLRITNAEQDKLAEFGEPLVELGGDFTGTLTRPGADTATTVTFSLPARSVRLPTDFPVKRTWDLYDTDDADVVAKVWADEIKDRMTEAKTTLLASTSPLVGRTVDTI